MEKKRPAIVDAFMEMPRQQQALMAIILLFWLAASVAHLRAWITHNPPLKIELVIFTNAAILALAVWHSVMVKGRNATIAFFSTRGPVSWFCEFIGHNYGWFFGEYDYTDTLWPRVGGVPVIIIITWSCIIYSAFMLIDWLLGLNGETRARTWWGKTLWSGLLAAATATMVCAWDLMIDPFATSGVWVEAVGKEPWWFWTYGGPYLKELSPGERRAHRQFRGLVAGPLLHHLHLLPLLPAAQPGQGQPLQLLPPALLRVHLLLRGHPDTGDEPLGKTAWTRWP